MYRAGRHLKGQGVSVDRLEVFFRGKRKAEDEMATLNTKSIPDSLHRKLLALVKKERLSVAHEVI